MTRHTTRPTPDESTVPPRDDIPSDARMHADAASARTVTEANASADASARGGASP